MNTVLDVRAIQREEYNALEQSLSNINMELLKGMDPLHTDNILPTLESLKTLLIDVQPNHWYLYRRTLDVLHMLLINRMIYNRKFKSPLYQYPDLENRRIFAHSEIQFRDLFAIYMYAIESSLVQEA